MPINVADVMKLLGTLCDDAGLKVTVTEALRGGLIAGASTVVGGLLLGPVGLAIGGAAGGLTAAYMGRGKFKPISTVFYEMDERQKRILYDRAMNIVQSLTFEDIVTLNALVMGNLIIRQQLIDCCVDHLKDHLKMQIQD